MAAYEIGSLEAMTGIPRNTISAWERRYKLLNPTRDPNSGHRLYTDADVALLERVKAAVDSGLRIGQAVEAVRDGTVG